MREKRWLYFALGLTTVISMGAVTNQLVPRASGDPALSGQAIQVPDGALQATAAPRDPRRAFYLTLSRHQGGPGAAAVGPLDACDDGFHMASLFEVTEPSVLRYAWRHKNALTRADSGQGPPTGAPGWIRTGYRNDGFALSAGRVNCFSWTNVHEDGTVVKLSSNWENPGQGAFLIRGTPWAAKVDFCTAEHSVWCVEDYPGSSGVR